RNRDEAESQRTYAVVKALRKRYSVKLDMPAVLLPSAETVAQDRTTDARKAPMRREDDGDENSELLRFQIRFDSVVKHFKWNKYARNCNLLQLKPSTECEKYNRCGNYSVCDERKEFDFGKCSCINGFDLVNQNQSAGCKRRVPLNCSQNVREGEFRELRGIKFPEFGSVIFLSNSEACKDVCVRDCSCNAYAFFRGVEHGGQSINIRIAESELGGKGNSKVWIIFFHHSLDLLSLKKKDFSVFEKEENKDYSVTSSSSTIQVLVSDLLDTSELTIFTFNSRNFSGGREIAVKRLSEKSKQGLEEFKNEILLIDVSLKTTRSRVHAKQELGQFHFSLDRRKRWDIIGGIARGLLYLHRDSRLQIIYHDPQATNILLDREVNPKISDFGMARIFNYRQDQANTIRVVGTYFGVLILEIVSESKNVSFRGSEYGSLIGYNLWRQRKTKELIDPTVKDTKDVNEAMRRIHMGMLCTQASIVGGQDVATVNHITLTTVVAR
ncbi:hypothetical protein HID58_013567, partial [Brassica napus]